MKQQTNIQGGDRTQDQVDSEIGESIAEMLELKVGKNGRINTTWGTKTFTGLTRSIERLIRESREHAEVCDSNLM